MNGRPMERYGRGAAFGNGPAPNSIDQFKDGGRLAYLGANGGRGEIPQGVVSGIGGAGAGQVVGPNGVASNSKGMAAMSMTQFAAVSGVFWVALVSVWDAVIPAPPPPPPIAVHSLTYDAGYIIQERTVKKPSWVAGWQAEIVDDRSGRTVPNCVGSGFWNYPGGTIAPRISLGEWVGNPACELTPGRYYPRASYWDGSFKTVFRGDVFEVTE